MMTYCFFFFFSSRRRHTRWPRDWSSDVCSSDLRGLAGLTSPMVGRDTELAQLLSLVATIRAGRGRAAVLLGEPGVGKSRLLAEARAAVIHGGGDGTNTGDLAWIEARCVSYGENVPFGLVGNLITACLSLSASGSPEERRIALDERAHETFGEGWQ